MNTVNVLSLFLITLLGAIYFGKSEKEQSNYISGLISSLQVTINRAEFLLNDINIKHPQVAGISNPEIEKNINKKLEQLFVSQNNTLQQNNSTVEDEAVLGDGEYLIYDCDFKTKQIKDLLIITLDDRIYTGGAHGRSSKSIYHINMRTGRFYILKDLFKEACDYSQKITQIIKKQIIDDPISFTYYCPEDVVINLNHDFRVGRTGIKIFFPTYSIASYVAGIPSFIVTYEEIEEMIDKNGDFYQSFR
jgi:hypothetical protein